MTEKDRWLGRYQEYWEGRPLFISGWNDKETRAGLMIPRKYFPAGARVLSVGEGLSDFAGGVTG
jgi:hypothetical protein